MVKISVLVVVAELCVRLPTTMAPGFKTMLAFTVLVSIPLWVMEILLLGARKLGVNEQSAAYTGLDTFGPMERKAIAERAKTVKTMRKENMYLVNPGSLNLGFIAD